MGAGEELELAPAPLAPGVRMVGPLRVMARPHLDLAGDSSSSDSDDDAAEDETAEEDPEEALEEPPPHRAVDLIPAVIHRTTMCPHRLWLSRNPYTYLEVNDSRAAAGDDDDKFTMVQAWRCSWRCDCCGVEGRLRLVYSCHACRLDVCVPCSRRIARPAERAVPEREPKEAAVGARAAAAARAAAERLVPWVDLYDAPGRVGGAPEDLASEAPGKHDGTPTSLLPF